MSFFSRFFNKKPKVAPMPAKMPGKMHEKIYTKNTNNAPNIIAPDQPTLNITFLKGSEDFKDHQKIALAGFVREAISLLLLAQKAAENSFKDDTDRVEVWFGNSDPGTITCVREVVRRMYEVFTDRTKFISFAPEMAAAYIPKFPSNRPSYLKNSDDLVTRPDDFVKYSYDWLKRYQATANLLQFCGDSSDQKARAIRIRNNNMNTKRQLGIVMNQKDYPDYSSEEDQSWRHVNKLNGETSGSYNEHGVDSFKYLNHTGTKNSTGFQSEDAPEIFDNRGFGGYTIIVGDNLLNPSATLEQRCEIIFHQMMRNIVGTSDMSPGRIGLAIDLRRICLETAAYDSMRTLSDGGNFGFFIAGFAGPVAEADLEYLKTKGGYYSASDNPATHKEKQERFNTVALATKKNRRIVFECKVVR